MKWLAGIAILIGLALFGYGAYVTVDQIRLLQRAQSVDAVVHSAEVKTSRSEYDTAYVPIVSYTYTVDGREYQSTTVTPTEEEHDLDWAQGIVSRYPPGAACQAWYSPDDPQRSFLLKRYGSLPYALHMMGIILVGMGLAIGSLARTQHRAPPAPIDQGDGWYELQAPQQLRGAIRTYLGIGAAWVVIGVIANGHYLAVSQPPRGWLYWGVLVVYAGVGLLVLGLGLWALWVGRHLGDARVFINIPQPVTGAPLQVLVQHQAQRPVRVKDLALRLECKSTTFNPLAANPLEEKKLVELVQHRLHDHELPAGDWINEVTQFDVPPFAPPSGKDPASRGTHIDWSIHLKLSIAGAPPYPDRFRIQVQRGQIPTSTTAL